MRWLSSLMIFGMLVAVVQAQDVKPNERKSRSRPTGTLEIPDPFHEWRNFDRTMDAMGMGEGGGGMEGMGGMEMMGGRMGGSDVIVFNRQYQFKVDLQKAIKMLKDAKRDDSKKRIKSFVRDALESRYQLMISERQSEIKALETELAKLKADVERRAQAKDRVVDLQLQSVELAAEGLLEIDGAPAAGGSAGGGEFGFGN